MAETSDHESMNVPALRKAILGTPGLHTFASVINTVRLFQFAALTLAAPSIWVQKMLPG